MSITRLTSITQLNDILSNSGDTLTVIDFHATWCSPCHAIAPVFEGLAKQYPKVKFLKCDVDTAKDVASEYEISAMPTFIFLQGNKQVRLIKGADKTALQNTLKQLVTSADAFPGQGDTLRDSSSASPSTGNMWSNLDPQVKILLGLIVAYIFFWMM